MLEATAGDDAVHTEVRKAWPAEMELGEGPAWDAARQVLWFVDIKKQRVHRLDPAAPALASWSAPAQVGWVLPTTAGFHLAGLQSGLSRFHPATGMFEHLAQVEPQLPSNRLNDATVGPDGAVWFGSMDDCEASPTGRVYRFHGGVLTRTSIAPVTITNGPAVSDDGRTLYHVDTVGGVVHAVSVTAEGTTGEQRQFVRIDANDGHPDGVTVDSAGNVWVALWGGWGVRCYARDGRLLREVKMPASNITKLAFGGPDLRRAYVTSARAGLSPEALALQPDAGSLFEFDVEVPGIPLPPARVLPS